VTEPCPRCGKEETLLLKAEDFEKAKVSGVAGKAISHGDHTLVIFFGSKGSHRGQYIYENDMKFLRRRNQIRAPFENAFVYGILIIYPLQEEFDDSYFPIFSEQQTAFMVTTILASLADLRVPEGKLVTLTFAGIDLFVIKSQETILLVAPREDKESFVKQMTPALLNRPITPATVDAVFTSSIIEDVMLSQNRFVRLANVYPQFLGSQVPQNQLNLLIQSIARDLRIPQSIIDQIVSLLLKYANGSRNLRVFFEEWVSTLVVDDLNLFLTILSYLEKNQYLIVKEKRVFLKRREVGVRLGGNQYAETT
jgi:hypothetical protein